MKQAPISNTYRFFVAPELLATDDVLLTDPALVHQMGRVLRLRAGQRVLLLDGMGTACQVLLDAVERGQVRGHVEQRQPAGGELPLHLTIAIALLRSEPFEWVLQKGTELGAAAFLPVAFARSLPTERTSERKQTRWHTIVREAAEQSCRAIIPRILEPHTAAAACVHLAHADLALLLWEGEHHRDEPRTLANSLQPWWAQQHSTTTASRPHIAVLSGPEGGITPQELTTAQEHGIIPVSLGPRILRAETAPIAATAAIGYHCECNS